MYSFPDNLYSDVRVEDVSKSDIVVSLGRTDNMKEQKYVAAFVRVFDGERWYYSSTTNLDSIQEELDRLASLAKENSNIEENSIVRKFEVNKGSYLSYKEGEDFSLVSLREKFDLLSSYFPLIGKSELVKFWRGQYIDQRVVKSFFSSKGADLTFDYQRVGFRLLYQMVCGEDQFMDRFDLAGNKLDEIRGLHEEVRRTIKTSEDFIRHAKPITPGKYPVVLSPEAAGVFAHESFGHKSEADFMLGDRTMMEEWKIGRKVGSEILSIIDDGNKPGVGHVVFDDEGTKAVETHLIKDGYLSGRLHSAETAAALEEELTGNARAVNFEYEPVVRMTTTFISPGELSFEELLSGIKDGVFVDSLNHGSGMSTFTLAPNRAYLIREGKITEPVKISVVTGSVFQTLNEIEGLTEDFKLLSFSLGGCGKMEQFPLPVGFGGPFVRVRSLNIH
ncbi:MAG: TldD/PmbA family protein [Mesotoga sp.]|jgi:TldD protein|uniref:TldD/PmbA family protein n=1 Tax=unclassified Mesotoga TaxID=1184398 RepID=UPI000EF24B71|nr:MULTISPECIES: TldD/PmbA family protein [unclassified Mesotoga]NLT45418.1 TldD/PmbA family protein [Thermotogaceae bacterium]MDD2332832.1 TldD/PmbA family protein [Mesotoga sp.]MDD3680083.1 TldD/PmbA family protein [Mesotoga sp.]MDD4206663.1 TldD/PmbA family protein [Mesotoga sp.]MDD4824759.1 TldD/PmbA family protein [Mesotoga sp.]